MEIATTREVIEQIKIDLERIRRQRSWAPNFVNGVPHINFCIEDINILVTGIDRLEKERDKAKAEVERLRKDRDEWKTVALLHASGNRDG